MPGITLGKIVSQIILRIARWPQGPILMKTVSWSYSPAGVRQPLFQSLPQYVRLLQSQLKAERLASAQLRLEVEDAMKMSEDYRAHHHALNLVLVHLSLTQLRSSQLLQMFGGPDVARPSAFWSALSFVYSFFGAFICTSGELWCPVDVICVIAVIT